MSLSNYALSGKINYSSLTNKIDGAEYAKAKVQLWMYMLNDNMQPTKWFKANSKGTNVNFKRIQSEKDYKIGLIHLEEYMNEINKEFGFDFKLIVE